MPWTFINLAIAFLAFGALAKLTPCNPGQRAFANREQVDNALYWFTSVLLYGGLADLYVRGGAKFLSAPRRPRSWPATARPRACRCWRRRA